jgi:hypothetical protein
MINQTFILTLTILLAAGSKTNANLKQSAEHPHLNRAFDLNSDLDNFTIQIYPHILNPKFIKTKHESDKTRWFLINQPTLRNFEIKTNSLSFELNFNVSSDENLKQAVFELQKKHNTTIKNPQIIKILPDQLQCGVLVLNNQISKWSNLTDHSSKGYFQANVMLYLDWADVTVEIPQNYFQKKLNKNQIVIECDFIIDASFTINYDFDSEQYLKDQASLMFGKSTSSLITKHQLELLSQSVLIKTGLFDTLYYQRIANGFIHQILNECAETSQGFALMFDVITAKRRVSLWNKIDAESLKLALDDLFFVTILKLFQGQMGYPNKNPGNPNRKSGKSKQKIDEIQTIKKLLFLLDFP